MKYFLLIFSIGIGVLSCSPNDQDKGENRLQNARFSTLDTAIPFAGFYINERYINDLKANKSPRQSQGDYISCVTIPERTLQVTRMIWGFHDGGGDMVVVKKNGQYQLYNYYEESLSGLAHDIKILSDQKLKIGDLTFIKANKHFLEDLLFRGTYSSEDGSIVTFDEDGKVAGINGFSSYEPVFDYMGPGLDVDQIKFSRGKAEPETFGFQFKGDNLFLYELNCAEYDSLNNFCGVVEFGETLYKLRKQ